MRRLVLASCLCFLRWPSTTPMTRPRPAPATAPMAAPNNTCSASFCTAAEMPPLIVPSNAPKHRAGGEIARHVVTRMATAAVGQAERQTESRARQRADTDA